VSYIGGLWFDALKALPDLDLRRNALFEGSITLFRGSLDEVAVQVNACSTVQEVKKACSLIPIFTGKWHQH
jgi:hypothetical protein